MPTVATALYTFNANELLTLGIAAYAAVISTFVLGWDAYKWLASGAKIDVSASSGMLLVGGAVPDPNTYITLTALNVGDRPTTITNLGGMYFDSWWRAYVTCHARHTRKVEGRAVLGASLSNAMLGIAIFIAP